jgi:diaminohydroxyphosphoribosylaminopyrimidine deaminase / 5-amino-6-(5-phosphoribosylamino)uracil reductase
VAQQPFETAPDQDDIAGIEEERAWTVLLAAAEAAERLDRIGELAVFGISREGRLRAVPFDDPGAVLTWRPASGWECHWPGLDHRAPLMDLYLPICSGTSARPVTVGHLGQSLDGFIATHAGESRWVTGQENLLHMHRLRALTDAVVVGAATVALDDPQLTTRMVPGPNPLRVVLDPGRRLGDQYRVFNDPTAETLCVCAHSMIDAGPPRLGLATVVGVDGSADGLDVHAVMRLLRDRSCARIFVEGGGVTVSMFLEANLLDRLHMAIAPLLIGDGRPAIRLRAPAALGDCVRPRYRVFRMGGDVLFDCELGGDAPPITPGTAAPRSVTRVI